MPNIKSAEKRLRQNIARRQRNRAAKHELRTHCKKVDAAVESGNLEQAAGQLRVASKLLDQAAARKVVHRNAAARLKSRLAAKIKRAKSPA